MIRDLDIDALIDTIPQRKNIALVVAVRVLAHQGTRFSLFPILVIGTHGCDVDEQAARRVDPARIDQIVAVLGGADYIVWIDFQHVGAALGHAGDVVVVFGHVVVVAQEMQAWFGDLHVEIAVPWEDLLLFGQQAQTKPWYK